MQMKDINGEVRLSMKDFAELLNSVEQADKEAQMVVQNHKDAIEMMGDFLQFLGTKQYFDDIKEEFNASHNRLSLDKNPQNGRIIIKLDGQKIHSQDS